MSSPSDETAPICTICSEKIMEDRNVLSLICGHRFHYYPTDDCSGILAWFDSGKHSCPNCRELMPKLPAAATSLPTQNRNRFLAGVLQWPQLIREAEQQTNRPPHLFRVREELSPTQLVDRSHNWPRDTEPVTATGSVRTDDSGQTAIGSVRTDSGQTATGSVRTDSNFIEDWFRWTVAEAPENHGLPTAAIAAAIAAAAAEPPPDIDTEYAGVEDAAIIAEIEQLEILSGINESSPDDLSDSDHPEWGSEMQTVRELRSYLERRRAAREKFTDWLALIEFEVKTTRQLRDEMETFVPGSAELSRHASYLNGRAALETNLDLSRGDPSLQSVVGYSTSDFLKEFRELAWRYRNVVNTIEEYAATGYGGVTLTEMWQRLAVSKDIAVNYAKELLENETVHPMHSIFELLERLTLGVPHHSMDTIVDYRVRQYATVNNPTQSGYSAVQRADSIVEEIINMEFMRRMDLQRSYERG